MIILFQFMQGREVAIAFTSCLLTAAERNYSTAEKEHLIVWAVKQWHCYLEGVAFEVFIDHTALTSRLTCWTHQLSFEV